jgi:DHA3 family macrolide efflux protein-like MFS transporter
MEQDPQETPEAPKQRGLTGMPAFTAVWLGQTISLLGSLMTTFAFTIWAWEQTGEATSIALLGFAFLAPNILLSPFAGVLVDRWNRKWLMILSDLGAALATVIILLLYLSNSLQLWQLYLTEALAGAFQAVQFPAYMASITMMIRKEHYARASGMLSTSQSATDILAPILAGLALSLFGLLGVMVLDIATFLISITILAVVNVPQPPATQAGDEAEGNFWQEAAYGFRYIFQRASLLGLQLIFFSVNLISTLGIVLLAPMVWPSQVAAR